MSTPVTVNMEIPTEAIYEAFAQEHTWTRMLDIGSATALYQRLDRAGLIADDQFSEYLGPSSQMTGTYSIESTTGQMKTPCQPVKYIVSEHEGCTCPDAQGRAPSGWCKHRLALWIAHNLPMLNNLSARRLAA